MAELIGGIITYKQVIEKIHNNSNSNSMIETVAFIFDKDKGDVAFDVAKYKGTKFLRFLKQFTK